MQSNSDCVAALSLLAVACADAIKQGALQLVWDESSPGVDSYKVFRVDNGGHELLGTSTARYFLAKRPSDGYGNLCFAVVAYVGSQASANSAAYCYAPGATATTRSLSPSHTATQVDWNTPNILKCVRTFNAAYFFQTGDNAFGPAFTALFPFLVNESPLVGSTAVGSVFAGNEVALVNVAGPVLLGVQAACPVPKAAARISAVAGAAFDLGDLAHHKLYAATLTLKSSKTVGFASGRFALYDKGWCPVFVGPATREWWIAPVGNMTYNKAGRVQLATEPTVPIDVTPVVASWASYSNAYGFIVESAMPSDPAPNHNAACLTQFADPVLQIVYF